LAQDVFERHRIRIATRFAYGHGFTPHFRPEDEVMVLGQNLEDTRFIGFDEAIGITDDLHVEDYTSIYNLLQSMTKASLRGTVVYSRRAVKKSGLLRVGLTASTASMQRVPNRICSIYSAL
jgi:hypothetical protein